MATVRWRSAKRWGRIARRDAMTLWLAVRDPRVPWYAKLCGAAVAVYALSPIDLIPDFIPILGQLDDLIVVPIGIRLTMWLIPTPLVQEFRAKADRRTAG